MKNNIPNIINNAINSDIDRLHSVVEFGRYYKNVNTVVELDWVIDRNYVSNSIYEYINHFNPRYVVIIDDDDNNILKYVKFNSIPIKMIKTKIASISIGEIREFNVDHIYLRQLRGNTTSHSMIFFKEDQAELAKIIGMDPSELNRTSASEVIDYINVQTGSNLKKEI